MDINQQNLDELVAGMVAIGTRADGRKTLTEEQATLLVQAHSASALPQFSPIQQIRLNLLATTERGTAIINTLAMTAYNPNHSELQTVQQELQNLESLCEWILVGASCQLLQSTTHTAQTNTNDLSSSDSTPPKQST